MRTLIRAAFFLVFCALPAVATPQGAPPTRVPTAMTPEQEAAIREGVDLHDKGQFDEAIAKYQAVLAEHPSNVVAIFELAYSHFAKRDFDRTIETALKGTEFRSD